MRLSSTIRPPLPLVWLAIERQGRQAAIYWHLGVGSRDCVAASVSAVALFNDAFGVAYPLGEYDTCHAEGVVEFQVPARRLIARSVMAP